MPTQKILITGSQGQLGQSLDWLQNQGQTPGQSLILMSRAELDITRPEAIEAALSKHRPNILINAAAYTAVDKAESEPEQAMQLNGLAPGLLAQACTLNGVRLLHVSTDYVFDGIKADPYQEDASTHPASEYGRSKRAGELAVLDCAPSAIILRTSWVFSQFGNNFLKTMLRLGAERENLSIVADQTGGPTYAPHIARVLLDLAARSEAPSGIYHFAGEPAVSWYDFAIEIFSQAQACGYLSHIPTLEPIPTSAYPTAARRPTNSTLRQDILDNVLGRKHIPRNWRDGIQESLQMLLQEKKTKRQ
ncbi:dTDP-4-dehydrorhamnose reductase [Alcaligenes sp. NLF5-7]|uniref:dTDP-4-dehydrorhamnose reductase n=1 Tax=Alcaligenes sp. NLF5-7 TaxID=2918755 RepID=UPI0020C4AA4A|nr:dTDP-4-dehydrorhamnose reductase [Alcaligenes sp. NLF5-7]UTM03728.1 dTDP-4-dehydrorhamnose reductase [Alcaligenes sp. NLF5-7]